MRWLRIDHGKTWWEGIRGADENQGSHHCRPDRVGKITIGVTPRRNHWGEIIVADSMHVYRYMDIGTAKPTPEEEPVYPTTLLTLSTRMKPSVPVTFEPWLRMQ